VKRFDGTVTPSVWQYSIRQKRYSFTPHSSEIFSKEPSWQKTYWWRLSYSGAWKQRTSEIQRILEQLARVSGRETVLRVGHGEHEGLTWTRWEV
jgi:hypothetical protein